MEFLQICEDISKRQAKAEGFWWLDPIYMAIRALSNVKLGYISEPVGGIESLRLV